LPHKRDGPGPQGTTPGPELDERAPLLPHLKVPRKPIPPARDPSPKLTITDRRRPRDRSWRGFSVRLYARPGTDGAHALHALLRAVAQRFGLEVGDVQEVHEPTLKKETGPSA